MLRELSFISEADRRSQAVKVAGLISSATWGQGRSSADRQFYYMNGRPVDLPVVAKAVNEVYKSFNTHQLPLVVLDFTVPKGELGPRDKELIVRKRGYQRQSGQEVNLFA